MVVVLPSGGSLLGIILFFLSSLAFWLDDVIMTSPALLTDAVLMSSELLAILVGVAFIGLGGVLCVCELDLQLGWAALITRCQPLG
jgi:hypothetical protein